MAEHTCTDQCAHTVAIPGPVVYGVLAEVLEERRRQDAKWGQQNHPDGTRAIIPGDDMAAAMARRKCQTAAANGLVTWRHILFEEVAEAFAEADPERLRVELIQVAATAVAWAEAIDRRRQ